MCCTAAAADETFHDSVNSIIAGYGHLKRIDIPIFACDAGLAYNSRTSLPANVRLMAGCTKGESITGNSAMEVLLRISRCPAKSDPWSNLEILKQWTGCPWDAPPDKTSVAPSDKTSVAPSDEKVRQSLNPSEISCGTKGGYTWGGSSMHSTSILKRGRGYRSHPRHV